MMIRKLRGKKGRKGGTFGWGSALAADRSEPELKGPKPIKDDMAEGDADSSVDETSAQSKSDADGTPDTKGTSETKKQNEVALSEQAPSKDSVAVLEKKKSMAVPATATAAKLPAHPPSESQTGQPPVFATPANARLWRRSQNNLSYVAEVTRLYRDVFTPTRPKRHCSELLGRENLMRKIVQALEEERAHVVIAGERGMGKTSMANALAEIAKEAGYLVARITCTTDLTFERLIYLIFEELRKRVEEAPAGDALRTSLGVEELHDLLEGAPLDLSTVLGAFERLSSMQTIIVLDDFDRVRDTAFKTRTGELMKALSDQGGWISFVIFGHAYAPEELVRTELEAWAGFVGLRMGPISYEMALEIIGGGVHQLGVKLTDVFAGRIAELSQGVPSVLQWLCLLSVRRAIRRYSSEIMLEDLTEAVRDATDKVDPISLATYEKACCSRAKAPDELLFLAAKAPCDADGSFSAAAVSRLAKQIMGHETSELTAHGALSRFCDLDGVRIVDKVTTANGPRYRFVSQTMRSVVMLRNFERLSSINNDMISHDGQSGLLSPPEAP